MVGNNWWIYHELCVWVCECEQALLNHNAQPLDLKIDIQIAIDYHENSMRMDEWTGKKVSTRRIKI